MEFYIVGICPQINLSPVNVHYNNVLQRVNGNVVLNWRFGNDMCEIITVDSVCSVWTTPWIFNKHLIYHITNPTYTSVYLSQEYKCIISRMDCINAFLFVFVLSILHKLQHKTLLLLSINVKLHPLIIDLYWLPDLH